MKKALIVATIGGFICSFEKNDIKLLKNLGYQVFIACNTKGREKELEQLECNIIHLAIERNPLKKANLTSYRQLKDLIEKEKFDLIHCHTPVGGVLARMAGRKFRKSGTKVIYTAHGFHFFKGAPLANWLIYYPIERWLSRYTDVLVTINHEDYGRAKGFHAKSVEYVPGIGVDTEKFSPDSTVEKEKDRIYKEFGITQEDTVLLSVGELSARKNHRVIIEAASKLKNNNIKYLIVGEGPLKAEYQEMIKKLGLKNKVILTGFRRDIREICAVTDIFVFPSLQEGLPVALMEAMASGIPIVCSNIRGNTDLIDNGKGGYLVSPKDAEMFTRRIEQVIENPVQARKMAGYNLEVIKKFSVEEIRKKMNSIYLSVQKL